MLLPLAVTQDYLADVRKPDEAKKAVADTDFVPKPKVVKTDTTEVSLTIASTIASASGAGGG